MYVGVYIRSNLRMSSLIMPKCSDGETQWLTFSMMSHGYRQFFQKIYKNLLMNANTWITAESGEARYMIFEVNLGAI